MQFFDSNNAMIICLYSGIIQMIVIYSMLTDTSGYWNFSVLSDQIYLIDIAVIILIWVLAVLFFRRYKGDKVRAFGFLLFVMAFETAVDRCICIFGDFAHGSEGYDPDILLSYYLVYFVIIALEVLLMHAGIKIYHGKKVIRSARPLIIIFMIGFILSRGYQLILILTDVSEFLDIESGIFLCIFMLASLYDEDVKVALGAKVYDDSADFDI